MTLERGTRVGPYEIVSLRGAGGMGEVYRARDTRLDRSVAIKVLPPGLHANEALRARFEREARAISALSHPHICALFDIGTENGSDYLVMEFLEGETLAEKIARGPLSTSLVVRYGAQIAEALQQAHRAGITHRDLKPGNVMITAAGAKLLDFGLAKFIEPRVFSEHSAPETRIDPLTAEGTIVGTTAYMSPEQLEGKPLDHRSDIFALGVILYEMATGQRPFRGNSAASLIAAILGSDPVPLRTLQPGIAPALERVILTCLEKDPDERWQTAHDVGRQLRWMTESSATTEMQPVATTRSRRLPLAAIFVVVAALLGFLAARWLVPKRAGTPRVSLQFAQPPELSSHRSSELSAFVLSPDGQTVAFLAGSGGTLAIYLRKLDSFAFRKVEGTEGALSPFWSPTGEWLGYSMRGKLWKTKVGGSGTPAEALCDVSPFGARATWQAHTILFADSRGDRKEIYRVADTGGAAERVTSLQKGEWWQTWPTLLPDGTHFLYLSMTKESMDRTLVLGALGSPKRSVLARNVSFARMLGRDRIAFVRDGSLLAQRFDLDDGHPLGEPETIAADVAYFYPTARADFDASPAGVVVYRTDTSAGRLALYDRKGAVMKVLDDANLFWDHAISRDGKKAAVSVMTRSTGLMDVWIYDLARGMRDRFTSEPAIEVSPAWSPDGHAIVYSQAEGGTFPHLVRRPLNGAPAEDLTPRGPFQFSANYAPDGNTIYYENEGRTGTDIYRVTLPSKHVEPFLHTNFREGAPAVSPDGHWLAYASNATGMSEIYIQSLTPDPVRIRISNHGGNSPNWRGDGKELFYLSPDHAIMSAAPALTTGWEETTVTELFRVPDLGAATPTPDGLSFLISTNRNGATDTLFHLVTGLD